MINSLKEAQEELNKIPNINRGGCAISALALYRWIMKNENIKYRRLHFVFSFSTEEELKENKKRKKSNEIGESCSHVALYYKGRYRDSEGEHPYLKRYQLRCDEDFVIKAINNEKAGWAKGFDRKHIRTISKKLKIDLSDLKIF